MIIVIGILLILIGSYASIYVAQLKVVKEYLAILPYDLIPPEFVVNSLVFILVYIVYYVFENSKNKKILKDINIINAQLNNFLADKVFEIKKTNSKEVQQTITLLYSLVDDYTSLAENSKNKIEKCEESVENLRDLVDYQTPLVCKVNVNGKVVKANKNFLKFLAYDSEVKLNMQIKDIREIFDDELDDNWLNENLHKEMIVSIKSVKFSLKIEKVERQQTYVLNLLDVSKYEAEKEEIEKKVLYVGGKFKLSNAMNKSLETTMVRMLNYDNYAAHLGLGIMEMFEEMFVDKIKSLGYDEVFKVQNDIFAFYDINVKFEQYKKILEETIVVEIGDDSYIFNPKVVLSSGVNYEQAKQQILTSSKTLISKNKEEDIYNIELIRLINDNLLKNKIVLGYTLIENQADTMIINPVIKDGYSSSILDPDVVCKIAKEFNIHLVMLKQAILNNLSILKDKKIILNVSSSELLSTSLLRDLLILIQREELLVVFNIYFDSSYTNVLPLIKSIKQVAQVGIRSVGKGYINFKDIYALKVEYLEVDDSIIELIKQNPQWKFLLDSVKILLTAQKSKIIAKNYKDDRVFQISSEMKIYE